MIVSYTLMTVASNKILSTSPFEFCIGKRLELMVNDCDADDLSLKISCCSLPEQSMVSEVVNGVTYSGARNSVKSLLMTSESLRFINV